MCVSITLRSLLIVLVSAAAASTPAGGPPGKPRTASGRVVDVQGRPVAGAAIEISITSQDYRSVTIGEGFSGADGRFALTLSTNEYGDLGLGVDAPGFAHWGWAGFPRGIVNEEIVVHRVIDRTFLDALRSVRDPEERARHVLEIAASDDLPEIEEMFPYLAELRPDLAAIARARTAEPKVPRNGRSPADQALRLLSYRADPADDALVAPWIRKNWGGRAAHVAHLGLAADSTHELCDRWREIHFADQRIASNRPASVCREPVTDRTGTHVLVLFEVRYRYWGYDMHLVMRQEGMRWVLRGVAENSIEHYR